MVASWLQALTPVAAVPIPVVELFARLMIRLTVLNIYVMQPANVLLFLPVRLMIRLIV